MADLKEQRVLLAAWERFRLGEKVELSASGRMLAQRGRNRRRGYPEMAWIKSLGPGVVAAFSANPLLMTVSLDKDGSRVEAAHSFWNHLGEASGRYDPHHPDSAM